MLTVTLKAQKFIGAGGVDKVVSTVLIYAVKYGGTTGNTYVKLYSVNPTTKGPQTVLGTSNPVTLNNINGEGFTVYTFSSPISVPADFFVSVVLPTGATDTLVVVSTKDNCYSGDSLSYELWSPDNVWYAIESVWGSVSNPLQIDLAIFPEVCTTTGIEGEDVNNNIRIYPNPAQNEFVIDFAGNKQKDVIVNVCNIIGKQVKSISANGLTDHLMIDMSDQTTGVYIVTIKTVQGTIAQKLSLIK